MKLKTIPLAAFMAITLAGFASASTVLLSDNFNTVSGTQATFNSFLATDQAGTLATVTYTTELDGDGAGSYPVAPNYLTQHSNGGRMLLGGFHASTSYDVFASLDHNFATDANNLNQALEIKFNLDVNDSAANSWFGTIALGASKNLYSVNNAGNQFSSLFRDNGQTQQFSDGALVGDNAFQFADNDLITLVLSDTAGIGSAFSGNGSVAKMYVNSVLKATYTDLGLGANDGYLSFEARGTKAYYDNLVISAIPEPSAALLGGLGMLALLRRRRA